MYLSFEDIHIRYYTLKLFQSLAYAHSKGINKIGVFCLFWYNNSQTYLLFNKTKKGILHNDIKPLNVLFDAGTHEMFVVDFGLGEVLRIAWLDTLLHTN
jgi:serine/threonine protein kinase